MSDKPIRMVVPLAAGSTVDAVAQALAPSLNGLRGIRWWFKERTGGIPGTTQIVKAPKDGLTLRMISSNHVINWHLQIHSLRHAQGHHTDCSIGDGARGVDGQCETARQDRAGARCVCQIASGTTEFRIGRQWQLPSCPGELMISETGIDMKHVPYRGTGPLITDLVAVKEFNWDSCRCRRRWLHPDQGGHLALAVSTSTRSSALPGVPTMAEAGIAQVQLRRLDRPGGSRRPEQDQRGWLRCRHQIVDGVAGSADSVSGQGLMVVDKGPVEAPAFFQSELVEAPEARQQSRRYARLGQHMMVKTADLCDRFVRSGAGLCRRLAASYGGRSALYGQYETLPGPSRTQH